MMKMKTNFQVSLNFRMHKIAMIWTNEFDEIVFFFCSLFVLFFGFSFDLELRVAFLLCCLAFRREYRDDFHWIISMLILCTLKAYSSASCIIDFFTFSFVLFLFLYIFLEFFFAFFSILPFLFSFTIHDQMKFKFKLFAHKNIRVKKCVLTQTFKSKPNKYVK